MARRKKAHSDEWRKTTFNVTSEETIYCKDVKDINGDIKRIYKARGRVFLEYRSAILESCEYANAAGEHIILEQNWDGCAYVVYSPKAVFISTTEHLSDAVQTVRKISKFQPKASEDRIEERKKAYLKDREAWVNKNKRRLIDAHKKQFLVDKKAAENERKRIALRAAEEQKFSGTIGTW